MKGNSATMIMTNASTDFNCCDIHRLLRIQHLQHKHGFVCFKYTITPHIFEPGKFEHRRLLELHFKFRPSSFTIALVELLLIRTHLIRTLKLNPGSPPIIKNVVHTG